MPAYITLFNWTEQGIRSVKETANRAQAFRSGLESAGGRLIGIWWTMGQYDGMAIYEAPDAEVASRVSIATGMQGNIRTITMAAFGEEEIGRIVQGLP